MEEVLFSNPDIPSLHLPENEEAERNPLSRTYLKVQYLGVAIFMAFLIIPGVITILADAPGFVPIMIFIAWAVLFIAQMMMIPLGFKKKSYSLREKDITWRTGLLWHSVTTIPFLRVQHCEVNRGPLEQIFGLASLKVYTAGGGSTDLQIPGLLPDDAAKMKEFILRQIGKND